MKWRVLLVTLMVAGLVVMAALGVAIASEAASSAPKEGAAVTEGASSGSMRSLGLAIAAGLVGSLSILGAGLAVGRVGSAAVGAITEKPELFVRALIFVALAEGLAVLGFALAYMMMGAK